MGIRIELITDNPRSRLTRLRLEALLAQYDLSPFLFTCHIRIESGVIPHSHPVLTMNARHVENPERLLMTFVHEQLHWFVESLDPQKTGKAIAEIATLFPEVPEHQAGGGTDEGSTYLHLLIGVYEIESLRSLLGVSRASELYSTIDVYPWVYRTVMDHEASLKAIVAKHALEFRPADMLD